MDLMPVPGMVMRGSESASSGGAGCLRSVLYVLCVMRDCDTLAAAGMTLCRNVWRPAPWVP